MKTPLLAVAMLLCTFAAKAQYVTIPDPAFALFLQQNYPNCMNGNQMDTTCSDIVNEDELYCSHSSIVDLEGVQYFKNLVVLDCSYNNINTIPDLSHILLADFYCYSNHLTALPNLNDNLLTLDCSNNPITTIAALPSSLMFFEGHIMYLTALPSLPINLRELHVSNNQIDSLPLLPSSLTRLYCESNNLQHLPPLPSTLKYLRFGSNYQINAMPALPMGLIELECGATQITDLSSIPNTLEILDCSLLDIPGLPTLPPNLKKLRCAYDSLTTLPALPSSLSELWCEHNYLTSLPALPQGLLSLICNANSLTQIQDLPSIRVLNCAGNALTYIGNLPDSLQTFYCYGNPQLDCLPRIKYSHFLRFDNTNIKCIPNSLNAYSSNPSLDTMPICSPLINPNGCDINVNISGYTYNDANGNCNMDTSEQGLYGLTHSLYTNGVLLAQTSSNSGGLYSFEETGLGNFETYLDTTALPFTVLCPAGDVLYDTLTANDSIHFNRNFALQCKSGFDLAAQSVASAMVFRPANNTVVEIHAGDLANFYSASCAQGVSGTVTVKLHGPISYIAPAVNAIAPSNVSNNVLTWNVADFGTANALHDFNIIIQTDTFAQIGQQACFEVNVTPLTGDNDTSNNDLYYCFNIVNSYDPNDKTAYPSGNIDTMQEWLTYRVRFQNTGNAEAQHIYIMDTLDANVKVETFQLLSYSHQPNVQIKENIVRFNFPFINLPDSFSNEPGSHGYVQYKVKLKDDLPIGTTIHNTAYIYFDFNPPVVTNTATNTIAEEEDTVEVGIRSVSKTFDLLVYPNPANQQVTIVSSEQNKTITIYNVEGRAVLTHTMAGTAATLSIVQLSSGVYTIGIDGSNLRKRLIKL